MVHGLAVLQVLRVGGNKTHRERLPRFSRLVLSQFERPRNCKTGLRLETDTQENLVNVFGY